MMSNSQLEIDIWPSIVKVKKIFEYYAQYGERMNIDRLTSFRYMKMMKDAKVPLDKTSLEIIYKSENKSNTMSFNQFLNAIVKISSELTANISTKLDQKKIIFNFINNFLIPLEDNIDTSNIELEMNIDDVIANKEIVNTLMKASPVLFDIYKIYFSHEISICDDISFVKGESMKKYFSFLKDFEICPDLIATSAAFAVFQSETRNEEIDNLLNKQKQFYFGLIKNINIENEFRLNVKNANFLGQFFNFFKFLRVIIKISLISNHVSNNNENLSDNDKLTMLIVKIENSNGFNNIERKTNRTHSTKRIIKGEHALDNESTMYKSKRSNEDDVNINEDIESYIQERYGTALKKYFEELCQSEGDVNNRKKLKSEKFRKLIKNCEIEIEENEIDLLFVKFALKNNNMSMSINNSAMFIEYKQFISFLVFCADNKYGHLYNKKKSIDELISNQIFSKNQSTNQTDKKIKLMSQYIKENKRLYKNIVTSISPLFYFFSVNSDIMILPQLITFLKEFDIFPSLIAYNYINNIFHSLSLMCDYIDGVDVIDIERFTLFIFLLSNEIEFEEDLSIKDKVLFLVDRMAMSEGIERMIKKGNVKFNKGAKKINDNLKKEYPERYKGKEVKKNTFVNIFS